MYTPSDIWARLGGTDFVPAMLGRRSGPLLILGGGRCAWEDYGHVRPWKGEIMAVNDIGAHLHDTVAHWVSLHPEYLPGWRNYRQRHCYGNGQVPICHSQLVAEGVDVTWRLGNLGGTSGLYACFIGLMLGYTEIVLAGIPMDNSGHYFDPPWTQQTGFSDDHATKLSWEWAKVEIFGDRVRSLSGWTRDILGAP